MTTLTNLAVWLFALDAAVSATHELVGCGEGCGAFANVRLAIALLAALTGQVLLIAWIVSARVPTALALISGAFTAWATLGAPPLPLLLAQEPLAEMVTLLQVLLAVAMIRIVRRRSGRWYLRRADMVDKRSTLWRALGLTVLVTGASLVLVVVAVPTLLFGGIEQMTAGYIVFSRNAVMLEQRRFEGADGTTSVDLIGMMHLGERDTYEALFTALSDEGTVVLTEGVTDHDSLMATGFSYQGLAQSMGLTQQPALKEVLAERRAQGPAAEASGEFPAAPDQTGRRVSLESLQTRTSGGPEWPHIVHADVDAREFSPETIAYLDQVGRALQTRSLAEWVNLFSVKPPRSLDHDIIQLRNDRLLEALEAALEGYSRVAIPWGALHLPEIEAWLLARGFEVVSVERRPIIRYSTIWTKLFRLP